MPARPRRGWTGRLIRNTLLWLPVVAALWFLLTPLYNRFLMRAGSNLLHLFEHPAVTDLLPNAASVHDAYVARRDFSPGTSKVHAFRVSDMHFHLVLLGALFLAVPGVPWQRRLANLGVAAFATIAFDVLLICFYVKAVYATQLGGWSLAHYGALARNAYGLTWHLLDLPFKLGLPLVLWAAFYLPVLLDEVRRERVEPRGEAKR